MARVALTIDDTEHARLQSFADLLKQSRLGIPKSAFWIGDFRRLGNRIGKTVTQEELAEAIGVSRTWYGLLEAGYPVHASLSLMDRICRAFMLNEQQSASLLRLGVPVLSSILSSHAA